jgi:hypothetical protein
MAPGFSEPASYTTVRSLIAPTFDTVPYTGHGAHQTLDFLIALGQQLLIIFVGGQRLRVRLLGMTTSLRFASVEMTIPLRTRALLRLHLLEEHILLRMGLTGDRVQSIHRFRY